MIWLLVASVAVQAIYYLLLFSRLAGYQGGYVPETNKKSSIVICYRNESENIDKTLPSVLEQEFSEALLVNDNSADTTLDLLNKYKQEGVKVITIDKNTLGKKEALLQGILASKNNSIILTDADCIPRSRDWAKILSSIDAPFVIGYGPMKKGSGMVGLFSRYETYMTALQYLSYALAGIPYMGVGRNMKIEKNILLEHQNKILGKHLASGDDDLMINALSTGSNTKICIDPDSFVYSSSKSNLKAFLNQKTRHISTAPYYKNIHKIMLSVFSASQLLFFVVFILGMVSGTISIAFGVSMLVTKWVIQQSVNYFAMKKLEEDDLFWKFPALDILFFVYLLIVPVYYLFNKKNTSWS